MSKDINSVTMVGRVVRDAELKYTNSGVAQSRFSLAVNRSVKKGDQWTEEVSYFDFTLWGKQAEALNKFLTKGKQVAIKAELKQERWEKDGQAHSKVGFDISDIQLLSGGQGAKPADGGATGAPAGHPMGGDDDIPF